MGIYRTRAVRRRDHLVDGIIGGVAGVVLAIVLWFSTMVYWLP